MIFVDRSRIPVPEVLTSPRAEAARHRITALLSSASQEHLDQLRITFDSTIWRAAKPALIELFNGKCAYCESNVVYTGPADIEHFRPKAGAVSLKGTREQLYYAWLAYDWDNLLLVCAACNVRHGKEQWFPVTGARAQMLASVETCRATEKGTILDPCFDEPAEHLSFEKAGFCGAHTDRGRLTIELLSLNRTGLVDERRRAWYWASTVFQSYLMAVASGERDGAESERQHLVEMVSGRQPHTAVARAVVEAIVRRLGIPVDFSAALSESIAEALSREAFGRPAVLSSAPLQDTPAGEAPPSEPMLPPPPNRYRGREELPPLAHHCIRRIEIRNFKAIEAVDLDLPDSPAEGNDYVGALMVLGENATGKSSVLEAVALALLGTDQIAKLGLRGEDYIRRAEDWRRPAGDSSPAEVRVYFDSASAPVRLTIDPQSGEFQGNATPAVVLLGYGPRRFFADSRGVRRSRKTAACVKTLFDPVAVITNPSGWLMNCSDARFSAAVRALRQLLVLPDEAVVERPPRGKRQGAEIMFQVQGRAAPLKRLSEGYKTIIATGVDVMREMLRYWRDLETARGVVLIDEVETHLHPRWKMRIVQGLRQAMPQVQFIATTHDPLCLRGMYDGEVQVLRRDEESRIEQVTDLPNVRGLSVEQLLTSEFFGLFSTEDPEVERDLIRYVALAAERNRSPAEESELAQYRETARERLRIGTTPGSQLVHEAANEYMLQQRSVPQREKASIKREAVEKVVKLWKSLDLKDGLT